MFNDHLYKKNNPQSFVMLFGIICSFVAMYYCFKNNADYSYGFILISIVSFYFTVLLSTKQNIALPMTIGFLVRFAFCVFYTFINDGDADNYGVNALLYYNMSFKQAILNIPTSAYLYSWVISCIYRLFGVNFMPIRVFNGFLSTYSIWIAAEIANRMYESPEIENKVAWYMALFPNLVRFSCYYANREPILIFFVLLYIKFSYEYFKDRNIMALIMSTICLIIAMILHSAFLSLMFLTLLIIVKNHDNKDYKRKTILNIILTLAFCAFFIYLLHSGVGTEKSKLIGSDINIQNVTKLGNMSAEGRAAYLKNVYFSNPVLNLLFLPVRVLFFLFTPFVWMIRKPVDLLGLLDSLLYLWLSVQFIKKLRQSFTSDKSDYINLLSIVLIVIVFMFAAVTSNYGTAIRHRCKLFPMLLLITIEDLKIPFVVKKQ